MPDENTGIPLDALQEMKPAETPQPEPEPEPQAEPSTDEVQAPAPAPAPKSVKTAAQTPAQKARYSKADTSKGARRMVWMILVLLLFVLLFGASNVYQAFFNIPSMKSKIDQANAKIKEASNILSQVTEEKNSLILERDKLIKAKTKLEGDLDIRAKEIKSLNEQNDTMTRKRTELEGDIAKLIDEKALVEEDLSKANKDYKKVEEDFKKAVDKAHELENTIEELNKKVIAIQKQYDDLKSGTALQRKAENAKRLEWETEYKDKYTPAALKVVEQFNQLANALKEGMNYKTYRDMLKELEVPYEEFKMPLTEISYSNPSFKLITSSYNNYKNVSERWKNIVQANPGDEKWRDKIFKLENPVTTNRPWANQIQELWRDAVSSIVMAGLLIENMESFPDKCIVCNGAENVTCLTCNGNGKCVSCAATGYTDKNVPCTVCNASSKCPICLGIGLLPCKICILKNMELEKTVKSQAKPETPPTQETPKEDAPKTTEPIKEQPPETPTEETPKEEAPPEHEEN
ncbi:MAG TPA: hypothetical protein VJC37_00620 [Planctomycetota bacterium]|nr:hypothetical protein [Planctomycetota bacterium]